MRACVAAVVAPIVGTAAYLGWVGMRFGDPWLPLRVQNVEGLRGHTVSPVEPELVKRIRAETEKREEAWSEAELLKIP